MHTRSIDIAQFDYELPVTRIAAHPVHPRDQSRLLIYRSGQIRESRFAGLPEELDAGVQLCLNDSRVIPARLLFEKPTGGRIEVFCLEPDGIYPDVSTALAAKGRVIWRCLIGGASKWKKGMDLSHPVPGIDNGQGLLATLLEKKEDHFRIEFRWPEAAGTFAEILELAGRIPLPPYIKRDPGAADQIDYQTAYAREKGSVAAPTAGLHFTENILHALKEKGIEQLSLTLHVGAGTFKPVTASRLEEHAMHGEWVHLTRHALERLLQHRGKRVAVGTTVMRTLETIYWLGHRLCRDATASMDTLPQWEPYENPMDIPVDQTLQALLTRMDQMNTDSLWSRTELLIAPGYQLRMADGLITNFHQPRSTLLLLVSTFVGGDWHRVYRYALDNGFRFLSYGDSSLLWRNTADA